LALLARMSVVILVAVFAWPTFSAACCLGVEAAAAHLASADDGCCPAQPRGDDAQSEHNGGCSCPLSCASGCNGLGRAVVAAATCRVAPPGYVALARQHQAIADPLAPDPHDILHVPKHVVV
jgi:hypothetical protein